MNLSRNLPLHAQQIESVEVIDPSEKCSGNRTVSSKV